MKYLLIQIDNIPLEYVEAVVAAASKFRDERGLKVEVTPQIVNLLITEVSAEH